MWFQQIRVPHHLTNNHCNFHGEGSLTDLFFPAGRGRFQGEKTFFRGGMDINFSGKKGGKMILCFFSKVYDGKFLTNLTELTFCFTKQ